MQTEIAASLQYVFQWKYRYFLSLFLSTESLGFGRAFLSPPPDFTSGSVGCNCVELLAVQQRRLSQLLYVLC